MENHESKMVLILGVTGTGKGRLAFELAEAIGAEIISIDSMKVYRRMDIGTAKPPQEARERINYHLIDVVEPSDSFSVGLFLDAAMGAIEQIKHRKRKIIGVGGTALYIKALLYGLFDGPGTDEEIRKNLQAQAKAEGLEPLYRELAKIDPVAAGRISTNDAKRIIRSLEVYKITGKPISSLQKQWPEERGERTENRGQKREEDIRISGYQGAGYQDIRVSGNEHPQAAPVPTHRPGGHRSPAKSHASRLTGPWTIIGLRREKTEVNRRINKRVKKMIAEGLVSEVKSLLAEEEPLSPQARCAIGYAEIIDYLNGQMSLEEASELIKKNTRRLAKNQRTWFKTFNNVNWLDIKPEEPAEKIFERAKTLFRES